MTQSNVKMQHVIERIIYTEILISLIQANYL